MKPLFNLTILAIAGFIVATRLHAPGIAIQVLFWLMILLACAFAISVVNYIFRG
jgi:hypothetical protein